MSAAVTSMSVIASHWSTTQRGRRVADEVADLLAEHAGVGEEQRRLPPVHEHVGSLLGRRAAGSTLCQPSPAVDVAEHLAVGPPAALEEQQDRQHDGDEDALQHAEEHDAGGGHQREHERRSCAPSA